MMAAATGCQARLSGLLEGLFALPESLDREISGIELDSRRIKPGVLFMACKGGNSDGRSYIDDAIRLGAGAVLVEADAEWSECRQVQDVPVVPVAGLPQLMHMLAARYFGEPAAAFQLMGITGTNGKTTCSMLLAQMLAMLGHRCGVIGTLGYGLLDEPFTINDAGPGTTPDAVTLQRIMNGLRKHQADTVVMEVSSHGLDQHRVNVDDFTLALFTNLSRDHLDFHGSMEAYVAAKRRLFSGKNLQIAVLNQDDASSIGTRPMLDEKISSFSWSLANPKADVHAKNLQFHAHGMSMQVVTPWGTWQASCPLMGSYNAANVLAVLSATLALECKKLSFNPERIVAALQQLKPVPGRMQLVGSWPVTVVVDYAHTPDGLEKALAAVREHSKGRVFCVFGCGGGRDKGKRPMMGRIAANQADLVILTEDNPREEASQDIIDDILAGIPDLGNVKSVPDRRLAIQHAVGSAQPGDVVLLAGKGHEQYQEFAGMKIAFDDVKEAKAILEERFESGSIKDAARRGQGD